MAVEKRLKFILLREAIILFLFVIIGGFLIYLGWPSSLKIKSLSSSLILIGGYLFFLGYPTYLFIRLLKWSIKSILKKKEE